MTGTSNQQVIQMLRGLIIERQRLLIREANYLRGLVGLPPVRAEKHEGDQTSGARGSGTDSRERSR